MSTQRQNTQSTTQIKLDSVHLPVAAAAWRLPELIGAAISAGVVGIFTLGVIGFAVIVMKDAPAFNEAERKRQAFYDECYANVTLQNPQAYPSRVDKLCRAKSQLYKAQLERAQS
jgi:hypothetical protein